MTHGNCRNDPIATEGGGPWAGEDEAQVREGGRLGHHMQPNMPCARSDAVELLEDHNFCLGGADDEAKGLAKAVHAIQKLKGLGSGGRPR